MKKSNNLALVAAFGLVCGFAPRFAYAEGLVDASVLIPEPAEFIPMLVAFLVIFVVAKKMLWPGVLENFDKRQEVVETSLEDASSAQDEAEKLSEEYKAKLAELDVLHKQVVDEAKAEAEKEVSKIKERARAEAQEYMAEAKADIEQQKQQAMVDLAAQAANLSVDMCQRILKEQLTEEKQVQLNQRLVNDYLSEVGRSYGK